MTTEIYRPRTAAGVVKYMELTHSMNVYIDVYLQLPTVNHQGELLACTMCRNEYHLMSHGDLANLALTSDYTPSADLNTDWWFNAVNEAGSELDIFLQTDGGKVYLCAESTAALLMVVRNFEPGREIPVDSMAGMPYSAIHIERDDTTCLRPARPE